MYPSSDKNLNYETDHAIFFFSAAFDPLNNWSAHAVRIWGKAFPTAEHAYHFRNFSDTLPDVAEKIRHATSPWAVIQIESQHNLRSTNWRKNKLAIMTEIVRAKVVQNADVRACLLATGDKQIIENSPWDSFWGAGPDGMGQNHLGKIWMQIRAELPKEIRV